MAVPAKESTTHPHVIGLDLYRNAQVMSMNEQQFARLAVGGGRVASPVAPPRPGGREVLDFLDDDADGFDFALRELRAELAPASWLERLLVDQIVLSASRLRAAAEAERLGRPTSEWAPLADLAQQSLAAALQRLAEQREARRPTASPWSPGWHGPERSAEDGPKEWSWTGPSPGDDDEGDADEVSWLDHDELVPVVAEAERPAAWRVRDEPTWRARLVFDEAGDEDWPVVRGTRISVGRVVTLVIDGAKWSDILAMHPELCEADIRACLAYTVEQDGPFVPAVGGL